MVVGVVGLGLIGGSLAKAVKSCTIHQVLAADRDEWVLKQAMEQKDADGVLDEQSISQCDLLLLALYPEATADWLREMAPHIRRDAVVVDMCGVKRRMAQVMEDVSTQYGFVCIGGHPMAGREHSGYTWADAQIFKGASMLLTPENVSQAVMQKVTQFFLDLGFEKVSVTTPKEHDHIIAYTSQLAHVLSSAYIQNPILPSCRGFTAGSFQDLTRVAYLNETMWTELFMENGDYLAQEIQGLAQRLMQYATAIQERDEDGLRELLRKGRIAKEEWEAME